jgi:hypothetical protein
MKVRGPLRALASHFANPMPQHENQFNLLIDRYFLEKHRYGARIEFAENQNI